MTTKSYFMPKQTFLNLPEAKQRKIIAAASDEFSAYGLENASTNRIVANSGISKGSFYQYFEDKRDLFNHLMRILENEKTDFFRDKHPPNTGLDTFAYFRWVIKTGMEFNSAYPRLAQAISRVLFTDGLYFGPIFADLRQRSRAALTAMVNQARAQGELNPKVDIEMAVLVMETWSNVNTNSMLQPISQQEDVTTWAHSPEAKKMIDQTLYVMEYGLRNVA